MIHKIRTIQLYFFLSGSNTRDPYLRDLEVQIAKKQERKQREKEPAPEWWERKPQPKVNMPSRPHPSQVTLYLMYSQRGPLRGDPIASTFDNRFTVFSSIFQYYYYF